MSEVDGLLNLMRREAQRVFDNRTTTRMGKVTSYNPQTHSCKVEIQPELAETGWLPIATVWSGNGFGLFTPPSPGDQVQVEFQEGNFETGIVVGRFWSDEDKPLHEDNGCPAGEMWIVHKSGTYIKLLNSGDIKIHCSGTITSDASQWNHTGDIAVTGTITVTENVEAQGQVKDTGATIVLGTHIHPENDDGGPTGPPIPG